jgi:metallo-beta-lactamase family protein
LSAHADRDELIAWLARSPKPPSRVWLNHGEPAASDALRLAIRDRLGWEAKVVREGQIVAAAPNHDRG